MNPKCSKVHNVPKGIKIQQYINIIALKRPFQSYIKLFKHSFLKWLKVKGFDNLIFDLSNGHNLCYMSFFFENVT